MNASTTTSSTINTRASSTDIPAREQTQLEEWGAHCSLPNCNMLDFLPLQCPDCKKWFCSNHYKPSLMSSDSDHLCEEFIVKHNNTQSAKSRTEPAVNKVGIQNKKCSYSRCKTTMFAPITCQSCKLSYCPTHRLELDHLCKKSSSSASSSTAKTGIGINLNYSNVLKNYWVNPSTDKEKASQPTSNVLGSRPSGHKSDLNSNLQAFSINQGLSKITSSRRNKSELESKQKALEFRMKNGLLTESDKLEIRKLEEQSKLRQSSKSNNPQSNPSDCCIV